MFKEGSIAECARAFLDIVPMFANNLIMKMRPFHNDGIIDQWITATDHSHNMAEWVG